jgi:GAF domain-containing protein
LFSAYLRYRLLYEFCILVTSETRIDRLLDVILDKLIDLTGAERSLILLFDKQGNTAYQIGRNLKQEDISAPTFELSWSIINKVRESRETVFLKNALEDPEFKDAKSVLRLRILSVMCLPLVFNNHLFGVLYVDNCTVQGIFRQHTYELM